MSEWLNRLLGRKSPSTPSRISQEWIEALQLQLTPLIEAGEEKLARNLYQYVLTGESLSILSEVSNTENITDKLLLTGSRWIYSKESIYLNFEDLPVAVARRWVNILKATAAHLEGNFVFDFPDNVHWPEILLVHASGLKFREIQYHPSQHKVLDYKIFESILAVENLPPSLLLTHAFKTKVKDRLTPRRRSLLVLKLKDYPEAVARYSKEIAPFLKDPELEQRLHIMEMLKPLADQTLDEFSDAIAEYVTDERKQIRNIAQEFVRRCGQPLNISLQRYVREGNASQRLFALRAIHGRAAVSGDTNLKRWAFEKAQSDQAKEIQNLCKEWSAIEAIHSNQNYQLEYEIPKVHWPIEVTHDIEALLTSLVDNANIISKKYNLDIKRRAAALKAKGRPINNISLKKLFSEEEKSNLLKYVAADLNEMGEITILHGSYDDEIGTLLMEFCELPIITPKLFLKCLHYFNLDLTGMRLSTWSAEGFNRVYKRLQKPSLLEVLVMMEQTKLPYEHLKPAQQIFENFCSDSDDPIAQEWDPSHIWPFFAQNISLLENNLLDSSRQRDGFNRAGLFKAIAAFPTTPPSMIDDLFSLAFSTRITDRPHAQAALVNCPNKEARIIAALEDSKSEVRIAAIEWLGYLKNPSFVAVLERALVSEKNNVVKSIIIETLVGLNQSANKYVNRVQLINDAHSSRKITIPSSMAWLRWDKLPLLRWSDNSEPVSNEIVQRLLTSAVKLKSPEPNAFLKNICALFNPEDREQFGQFILESWLQGDIEPINSQEATHLATSLAKDTHRSIQSYPWAYRDSPWLNQTVSELTQTFLPKFLRQPAGSLITSKGVLAVVALCAGEGVAEPVEQYLQEWFGSRAAQGKALIAMLAWMDTPATTQLMLSIGNRFRTKSFQDEAIKQAEALAVRKGWSLPELADRTISTAGFDERGKLELNFGYRKFEARLLPNFKIELNNSIGEKLSSLPDPRQDDDPEQVKLAQNCFKSAVKEISGIVALQSKRLYEALCTEREWTYAEWSDYFAKHPIMTQLIVRLVWIQWDGKTAVNSFIPVEDGSLIDATNKAVLLDPESRIRIAHDFLLGEQSISQWQHYFITNEITPLFQQFGKGIYILPKDLYKNYQIDEFEGHMVKAFSLRDQATYLGYTRSGVQFKSWFHMYSKEFPSLGLEAIVQFTGNSLPEKNRLVSLQLLYFIKLDREKRWKQSRIALDQVPQVLLSECYNDMRLMAAEGSGYDREWLTKSDF